MTTSRDKAARFSRLSRGKNTTVSVDADDDTTVTMEGNAVAFNVQNASDASTVYLRSDGGAPSSSDGWTLAAGSATGWIDCVGETALRIIASDDATRVDVWQILDEAP